MNPYHLVEHSTAMDPLIIDQGNTHNSYIWLQIEIVELMRLTQNLYDELKIN